MFLLVSHKKWLQLAQYGKFLTILTWFYQQFWADLQNAFPFKKHNHRSVISSSPFTIIKHITCTSLLLIHCRKKPYMVLLWKAKHEERKCPFKKRKNKKNQLDINDYFPWSRKKHRPFWRKICQYWLIAPLEITVTVSINIGTLTPHITQKPGTERKYSTCYWNAANLRWSKHSRYLEFTVTLHSHSGQEAIPLDPAETKHGLFFFLFWKPNAVSWTEIFNAWIVKQN